jgi:hypothetical protein
VRVESRQMYDLVTTRVTSSNRNFHRQVVLVV